MLQPILLDGNLYTCLNPNLLPCRSKTLLLLNVPNIIIVVVVIVTIFIFDF